MEQIYPNMTTTLPLAGNTSSTFWRKADLIYPPGTSMPIVDTATIPSITIEEVMEQYPHLVQKAADEVLTEAAKAQEQREKDYPTKEYTGGSVSYYKVDVLGPTTSEVPYTAECNDIIEALGMNYAEGNAFKAIWRSCAARNLGISKDGYKDGLYDAEKVVFFGKRMVEQAKNV